MTGLARISHTLSSRGRRVWLGCEVRDVRATRTPGRMPGQFSDDRYTAVLTNNWRIQLDVGCARAYRGVNAGARRVCACARGAQRVARGVRAMWSPRAPRGDRACRNAVTPCPTWGQGVPQCGHLVPDVGTGRAAMWSPRAPRGDRACRNVITPCPTWGQGVPQCGHPRAPRG